MKHATLFSVIFFLVTNNLIAQKTQIHINVFGNKIEVFNNPANKQDTTFDFNGQITINSIVNSQTLKNIKVIFSWDGSDPKNPLTKPVKSPQIYTLTATEVNKLSVSKNLNIKVTADGLSKPQTFVFTNVTTPSNDQNASKKDQSNPTFPKENDGATGIAYYDAIRLSALSCSINDQKVFLNILSNYYGKPLAPGRGVEAAFQDNSFLLTYIQSYGKNCVALNGGSLGNPSSSSIGNTIGGLNVTNIADGIAQFLIKRGTEEINIAFFNRFKNFLDSNVECKTLFPNTTEFLNGIESDQYSKIIQSLRTAFNKDLSNMIIDLNELIDLPKYQTLLAKFPEIRLAIKSSQILSELSQSDSSIHPALLIDQFAALREWNQIDSNLGNSWKLLDLISQSIRDTATIINRDSIISHIAGTQKYTIKKGDTTIEYTNNIYDKIDTLHRSDTVQNFAWISLKSFNKMLEDEVTLKIFLGLVYQKAAGIQFDIDHQSESVQSYMNANKKNILALTDLIENFLLLAEDIDQSAIEIKKEIKNKTKPTNEEYYTYINKAINVIDYGFKVANTIKPGIADNAYITMARNADNLYKNIYTKDYSAAVMNAYLILNQVFTEVDNKRSKVVDSLTELKSRISGKADSVIKNNKKIKNSNNTPKGYEGDSSYIANQNLINTLKDSNNIVRNNIDTFSAIGDTLSENRKIVAAILKYGTFLATVAMAKSPADVESAIETAALPAGSYTIKQSSKFNISLNAYVGYAWDNNWDLQEKKGIYIYQTGVYAPIGVSFSWGLGAKKEKGAISLFVSVLDLGGLVSYRLTNGSTDTLKQQITLESILSPSLQAIYELPKLPIAICAGWRLTPKLSYSGSETFETLVPKSVFNVSALIDIPIFNIVNKPKNR